MRSLYVIVAFLLWISDMPCQTVTSSCVAPDNIVKLYRKSADKLSVRRVEHIADTYKDSVALHKQISAQYLKALLAVYNATALPGRDTVTVVPIVLDGKIPYDLNSIYFNADSAQPWMKNLRNNTIPCGSTGIDYLISKYHLKKVSYYDNSYVYPYHSVSFRTDTNCYINRLCDKFNGLIAQNIGFYSASPNNEGRSPNFDIIDSINPNYIELKYKLSWGDCMVGCLYNRYWTFRVYSDCSVEYKGSYGNPLTFNLFAGVPEYNLEAGNLSLFPNPASQKLNISVPAIDVSTISLVVINSVGQLVLKDPQFDTTQDLDISNLQPGIYFICGEHKNINYKGRFIKQ